MREYDFREGGPVSEMAIVDTFTKLIFWEEQGYTEHDLLVIRALRSVELAVAGESHLEIGEYLRAMGVREMIGLVTRVRAELIAGRAVPPAASDLALAGGCSLQVISAAERSQIRQRRAH